MKRIPNKKKYLSNSFQDYGKEKKMIIKLVRGNNIQYRRNVSVFPKRFTPTRANNGRYKK